MALERLMDEQGEESIAVFIDQFMETSTKMSEMIQNLDNIREEVRGLRDGIDVSEDEKGSILAFSANDVEKHIRIEFDYQSGKVSDVYFTKGPEKLDLTFDELEETFKNLEEEGVAGLVWIRYHGEDHYLKGFGWANKQEQTRNSPSTIFAIGSRPIDFTVAAIQLLDQRGVISVDDKISKHFENVPNDKENMTIQHLLSGRSGLIDFFHIETDWDADLHYIDRNTAVNRILNSKLLFTPGTSREHSHTAFGLLAALVEIKSGMSYYEFLTENFFAPAGMKRTGEYGDRKDLTIADFAGGGGPQFIGLPNIPPNWGPTSWLIKGSGGMYSSLEDLQRFYKLVRSEQVLDNKHNRFFRGASANLDGSMRGFELFSAYEPPNSEVFLFLNQPGDLAKRRQLFRALENLIKN